jgi:hypothetical protein
MIVDVRRNTGINKKGCTSIASEKTKICSTCRIGCYCPSLVAGGSDTPESRPAEFRLAFSIACNTIVFVWNFAENPKRLSQMHNNTSTYAVHRLSRLFLSYQNQRRA